MILEFLKHFYWTNSPTHRWDNKSPPWAPCIFIEQPITKIEYSNNHMLQAHTMEEESLLQSRYLAPTPMFNATENTSQLRWSVDNTADYQTDPGNRLEASGFNAEDVFSVCHTFIIIISFAYFCPNLLFS